MSGEAGKMKHQTFQQKHHAGNHRCFSQILPQTGGGCSVGERRSQSNQQFGYQQRQPHSRQISRTHKGMREPPHSHQQNQFQSGYKSALFPMRTANRFAHMFPDEASSCIEQQVADNRQQAISNHKNPSILSFSMIFMQCFL